MLDFKIYFYLHLTHLINNFLNWKKKEKERNTAKEIPGAMILGLKCQRKGDSSIGK